MRKRVTVAVETTGGVRLVVKGAFHHVLEICTRADGGAELTADVSAALEARYDGWTRRGIRVLAVAERTVPARAAYTRDDECDMTFAGFLTFFDRPKEGVAEAIDPGPLIDGEDVAGDDLAEGLVQLGLRHAGDGGEQGIIRARPGDGRGAKDGPCGIGQRGDPADEDLAKGGRERRA